MTILPAHRYLDRSGRIWKILSVDAGYRYPFLAQGPSSVQSFSEEGRWSNHIETEYDLVSEAK